MLPRAVLALSCAATLLVAGCAQAVSGTGTAAAQAPFPRTTGQLSSLLATGTRSVRTAHIVLDFNVGGTAITGTGSEQLSNGKEVAGEITERLPGIGSLELRVLGGSTLYVRDPRRAATAKPWVHVTAATSDPMLQQIYSSMQSTASLGSLGSMKTLLDASQQLRLVGTETIDGVAVGHYHFAVQTQQLPADFPSRDAIIAAGVQQIPVELYVDHEGRARKGLDTVTVGTTTASVGFELSNFDAPVHITAPPASQTTDS